MPTLSPNAVTRRTFLASLASVGGAAAFCAPPPSGRPDILLVLADDLSPYELGCYGQAKIRTPNLDRLAAEGVRLTDCYSACPVCAPSRCALLTGLHLGHAQIRDNWERTQYDPEGGEGQWPLREGTDTLPRRLRAAGYHTACFGKWGLGGPDTAGRPLNQGFDRFFGYNCQRHAHQYWPTYLWDDDRRVSLDNPTFSPHQRLPQGVDPADPAAYASYRGRTYAPDRILAEAERHLAQAPRDRPLFLFYASPLPHVPLAPPESEVDAYAFPETPYRGQAGYLPQRRPRAAYAAMVTRLDRDVGRLLAAHRAAGRPWPPLVIFASDNGTTFNGGTDRAFFAATGPLGGHKCQLREGGIRVPFIAWWPGQIPAGLTLRTPAWLPDLYPTLCAAARIPVPAALDGCDLLPHLLGGPAPDRSPGKPLYWEYRGAQALRLGPWKALRLFPKSPLRLYHLPTDPGERNDLASQHPDIIQIAERQLAAQHIPLQGGPRIGG